jgi:Zn-dependent protease
MRPFFPHESQELRTIEPAAFRRLSVSLLEIGLVTGVVLRLLRALAHSTSGWAYVTAWSVLLLLLLLMATAHLANFTVRQWLWRAPAFGAVEAAGEMLASALLIALGREPLGTARAGFGDWPGIALTTVVSRVLAVSFWALLLAAVVVIVRRVVARRTWRAHEEAHGRHPQ